MTTVTDPRPAPAVRTRARRDVRRFSRYAAAAVLLVPATAVAVGRLFLTDDGDTRRALDLIAADPTRATAFAWLGFASRADRGAGVPRRRPPGPAAPTRR